VADLSSFSGRELHVCGNIRRIHVQTTEEVSYTREAIGVRGEGYTIAYGSFRDKMKCHAKDRCFCNGDTGIPFNRFSQEVKRSRSMAN
jgi:hypothetical protein